MVEGTWALGNAEQWVLPLAVVLFAMVLLGWSYARSPLRGWQRTAAFLVKMLVFDLLALCLLEPLWNTKVAKKGANSVVLLADNSASLGVPDPKTKLAPGSPILAVLDTHESSEPEWMKKLSDTFQVQRFTFDDRLHETPDFGALDFKGTHSALAGSLDAVLQRYDKQPLAGVLVFTDGNATDMELMARLEARKSAVPIFPVLIGNAISPMDIALGDVTVTQSAFEDSPVSLTAKTHATGFGGAELALVLRDEAGKTIHTVKHRLGASETECVFHAQFRPVAKGLSFIKATVLPVEMIALMSDDAKWLAASKEATLDNNTRTVAIERRSGPYRVLYVSGRPNWEYKFLRRALEPDDEVKLTALIRVAKREPKFEWRGRGGEMSNPLFRGFKTDVPEEVQRYDQPVFQRLGVTDPKELADGFPKTADDLFTAYRCIILDDLEAAFFTHEQMDLLERYVSVRGGSLLMLGGAECFQPGGYDTTPIGRMLPVYLDQMSKTTAPMEEAKFNLTREGWLEPWMRLRKTEGEEQARLASMTPFYSINQTFAIKPGASVLATVTDTNQTQRPAWVAHRYGSGRVAAVTIADWWRWGMHDSDSRVDMEKSWRQLLRYLLVDVPDRVELQTQHDAEGAHQMVKLQVRVRDKTFRAQEDALVKVELSDPDGKKSELIVEPSGTEAGLFETTVPAVAGGAWRVKGTVRDGENAPVGESSAGWTLNPLPDELQSLAVNRAALDRLAKMSGGRVITLDEVPVLAASLPDMKTPVTETRTEPLWHRTWVLLVLVVLLGTEWLLRRRWTWA